MSKRISIDNVQTILSILGEEDTCVGFEDNEQVQNAIEVLQAQIQNGINAGDFAESDILVTFH